MVDDWRAGRVGTPPNRRAYLRWRQRRQREQPNHVAESFKVSARNRTNVSPFLSEPNVMLFRKLFSEDVYDRKPHEPVRDCFAPARIFL